MFVVVCRNRLRRTPHPGRRLGSFISPAVMAMAFLVSCVPPSAVLVPAPDLSTLEMDPLRFAAITLRTDVEVKATVLGAATAATARTRWYVLERQERENRKGDFPEHEAEYVNLFLVSRVERIGADQDVARNRYLVVDLWHYYPARGIKTCHQWTIWEDDPQGRPMHAAFRFLVEDLNNTFLDERNVPLDSDTVKRLGDFYAQTRRLLLDKVRGRPGDIAHRTSPLIDLRALLG